MGLAKIRHAITIWNLLKNKFKNNRREEEVQAVLR